MRYNFKSSVLSEISSVASVSLRSARQNGSVRQAKRGLQRDASQASNPPWQRFRSEPQVVPPSMVSFADLRLGVLLPGLLRGPAAWGPSSRSPSRTCGLGPFLPVSFADLRLGFFLAGLLRGPAAWAFLHDTPPLILLSLSCFSYLAAICAPCP